MEKNNAITSFHHVSMKCKDPALFEKAVSFYKDVLGFVEERRWPEGVMLISGDEAPARLEIFLQRRRNPRTWCCTSFCAPDKNCGRTCRKS